VLDWAHVDASVRVLSLLGWAFPLLLSGIEIDFDRLRGTRQQLGGADGADAGLGEQGGHSGADQAAEILEAGFQGVQACDLAGELAQGLAQVLFADRLARAAEPGQPHRGPGTSAGRRS
jgi:hypothetical protein